VEVLTQNQTGVVEEVTQGRTTYEILAEEKQRAAAGEMRKVVGELRKVVMTAIDVLLAMNPGGEEGAEPDTSDDAAIETELSGVDNKDIETIAQKIPQWEGYFPVDADIQLAVDSINGKLDQFSPNAQRAVLYRVIMEQPERDAEFERDDRRQKALDRVLAYFDDSSPDQRESLAAELENRKAKEAA